MTSASMTTVPTKASSALTQAPGAGPDSCWPEPSTLLWETCEISLHAMVRYGHITKIWPFPTANLGIQTKSVSRIHLGGIQTYEIAPRSNRFSISHGW